MSWSLSTPLQTALPAHCEPTNDFLLQFSSSFYICIPTPLAFLSNTLGILSIIAWLFSQLPQIYKNYKISSTSGLSPFFLLQWMVADMCNMLGAIFTKQASWQVAIGAYYVFVDICLCSQWVWYERLRHTSAKSAVVHRPREKTGMVSRTIGSGLLMAALTEASPVTLSKPLDPGDIAITPSASPLLRAGTVLSWTATILYLCSRFPQLFKNWQRKSTAGLSPQLFIAAFCGNLFYSLAILTNPCAWSDFRPYGGHGWAGEDGSKRAEWVATALPFFLGAAGVLALDGAVGVQFGMYSGRDCDNLVIEERVETTQRRRRLSGWMRGWHPRRASFTEANEWDALRRARNRRVGDYGTLK